MRRLLLLLVAATTIVGCTGAPDTDATGAQIYLQVCARCHGNELGGRVGPALGAGSPTAERPDDYVIDVIADGRGSMPGFSSTLSAAQIDRLVAFLREEQAG